MKIDPKRLITAGGTLMCALGIGYFMQNTANAPAEQTAPVVASAGLVGAAPTLSMPETEVDQVEAPAVELTDVTLTSAAPAKPEVSAPSIAPKLDVVEVALKDDAPDQSALKSADPVTACEYTLTATTDAAAMVRLALNAPCMINERFTLHHNGMMLSQSTDANGQSDFLVPALTETAVFIVAFANGEGAVANTNVPALGFYDRALVQWSGAAAMQIHALEFGSDYDGSGHVWRGAARDLAAAVDGKGGFITRHGDAGMDNALVAEVYTFPSGSISRDGDVVLSVEAEVTTANCGRDIEAQSIQKSADGSLTSQDLVLSMPECNAVGDFLVLKNLLNDLKIAAK